MVLIKAMPLAWGTEFIIDALLGKAIVPIPLPTNISGNARPRKDIPGPISVSITNPTDDEQAHRREEPGPVPV